MLSRSRLLLASALLLTLPCATVNAATITLQLIDSYPRTGPFGLAFDGTHIYWSQSGRQITQMTTSGADTGVSWVGPVWSELAWDSSKGQLASAQFQTLYYYDVGGGNQTTETLNDAMTGITSLQDGFDIDSGDVWISPDVGNVYRYSQASGNFNGPNPFLGGAGGYSGVERVDVDTNTYIMVVNDALNPRRLCVHDLSTAELGCQALVNQRYEGLAFDGRYLWAADYFGNKIDKFDVLSDGGSILDPSAPIPEPSTLLLLIAGMGGVGIARRRLGNRSR
jgi:hypothetical protein